jgi:hypothetical protein
LLLLIRLLADGRTWCVDGGETDIVFERRRAGRRGISDIHALLPGGAVGDLHRRVRDDDVPANDGSLDACDDDDPVRVTRYLVVLDDVIATGR